MTLNITVTSDRCIYQSADYRLQDVTTKEAFDFQTQKLVLVNTSRWSATVCFSGVGRTATVDVSEWLAHRIAAIEFADPFERLLQELKTAEVWLSQITSFDNRHTFSVGAFIGSHPVIALVSNFEKLNEDPSPRAAPRMSISQEQPTKPKTFVSGQRQAVNRLERRQLEALVAKDPETNHVYTALAKINRAASKRTSLVSPACFTGHVRLTGEGGGQAHDMGNRPFLPKFAYQLSQLDVIRPLLDKQFGPGLGQLKSLSFTRTESTEEYHQIQLTEKPNNPNTHSNYGAFLQNVKKDGGGAEREYRRALELDANHVIALGNLANLLSNQGGQNEAVSLYEKALSINPGNLHVSLNYAKFLSREAKHRPQALKVIEKGITTNSDNRELILLRAILRLMEGAVVESLEDFGRARDKGANQADVEHGYACALHMSDAPVGDCIAAYRTAIALNPDNGALRLNLAQLLFIKADNVEANKELQKALALELDESAQLEAQFYLLAHSSPNPTDILGTLKRLLSNGARLRWNVERNIGVVKGHNPEKAERLRLLSKIMKGRQDQNVLDQLLSHWE